MKLLQNWIGATAAVAVLANAGAAAEAATFTDRAAFEAALATFQTITFEGLAAPNGQTLVTDGVTFAAMELFVVPSGFAAGDAYGSHYLEWQREPHTLTITLPGLSNGFGLDFIELFAEPADFIFTVNGVSTTVSSTDEVSFFGYTSDTAFQTFTIAAPGRFGTIDNFTFGDTGVPEPATWGLMILGFGGAGAVMRHRRRLLA